MALPEERPEGLDSPWALRAVKLMPHSDKRTALWPRLVDLYADLANHQTWTERQLPVVVLAPR